MSEIVTEDEPRYGRGLVRGVTAEIDSKTEIEAALPRTYTSSVTNQPMRIPYVVTLGRVNVYMERAEVERLHALLGRVLAEPENEEGS
jgi:hypothetical protein